MERCQHIPVLHSQKEQNQPESMRVRCRRCGLGTEWATGSIIQAWDGWAALMVKESAAAERAAVAADPGAPRAAAQAECWRAFCKGARRDPENFSVDAAARVGDDARIHAKIVSALREHLGGQLDERRIHDLFVALRKATKAFWLNAKLEAPALRDVPGELDGVTLADGITKSVSARVSAALESVVSARYAAGLKSTRPAPMFVTFLGAGGYDLEPKRAMDDGLMVGRAYEVLCGMVDRNTTKLILLGVPGYGYNSVMFDGVVETHPCMHRLYR